jgi:hypothetical protein
VDDRVGDQLGGDQGGDLDEGTLAPPVQDVGHEPAYLEGCREVSFEVTLDRRDRALDDVVAGVDNG